MHHPTFDATKLTWPTGALISLDRSIIRAPIGAVSDINSTERVFERHVLQLDDSQPHLVVRSHDLVDGYSDAPLLPTSLWPVWEAITEFAERGAEHHLRTDALARGNPRGTKTGSMTARMSSHKFGAVMRLIVP